MKKFIYLAILCVCSCGFADKNANPYGDVYNVPISSIRCSDPFIYADKTDFTYYMYSTGGGGKIYTRASKDLINWTEPITVMEYGEDFWAGPRAASWASEVHYYKGKYYLFTTTHSKEIIESIPGRYDIPHRATQIFVADSPRGPFKDFTNNKAHTPDNWASLDGTLWVEKGKPYMIFCHEWLQTVDGTMELVELPKDLSVPTKEPVTLFKASDAPWSGEMLELGEKTYGLDLGGNVTDGPWLFKTKKGKLGMLWSSWSKERYAIGVAYSQSGSVVGPWIQEEKPLFDNNGGHGMMFRTFEGQLKLCMHLTDQRDENPGRRPVFFDLDDSGEKLTIVPEKEPVKIAFDMTKTMSGRKIALKDFNKNFPSDWTDYNYLVLEMSATTGQRIYVGLNTETGYNELRNIFYAPNGKIRTVIPLGYFRDKPAGAHDLAATYNHRRPLVYINIDHGTRMPLVGVDSIGFRMHKPVKNESVTLYDVYLTVGDPGDKYLGDKPAIDEFGQWNLGEFEGKIHSEAELKAEWAAEEKALNAFKRNDRSRYGGNLAMRVKPSGFFRVEKVDNRWWFVDPDGYLFLSLSSNGTSAGGAGTVFNPLKGIYTNNPPKGYVETITTGGRRRGDRPEFNTRGPKRPDEIINFTGWNQYRRFGPNNTMAKATEMVVKRMDMWGLNTIGNWSGRNVIALNRKPFMLSLGNIGINTGLLGMPDVYAPDFASIVENGVKNSVTPYKNNKMLIGYFVANEPTWSNKELRLCELIMEAKDEMPLKKALVAYLEKNGDSVESKTAFVYETYEIFLSTVQKNLRKYDPNHLNLGIRYGSGVPSNEVLALSKKYFDVYSFNNYGSNPKIENMDIISQATDLPMIIGEFHFGTTDRGLGESLVRVVSQEDRGIAYKMYCEVAFAHPALIGTSWFTWYDQPLFGRGDGENYNIGLIDATDRPYKYMVKAIQEVEKECYDVHAGKKAPFSQVLERVGGDFPDIWE